MGKAPGGGVFFSASLVSDQKKLLSPIFVKFHFGSESKFSYVHMQPMVARKFIWASLFWVFFVILNWKFSELVIWYTSTELSVFFWVCKNLFFNGTFFGVFLCLSVSVCVGGLWIIWKHDFSQLGSNCLGVHCLFYFEYFVIIFGFLLVILVWVGIFFISFKNRYFS